MKSTKKAFISAVVTLVICFTMLVGSTLAWFTDSASVSIQTITTGELNITVEDGADDTANSLEGQTLTWQAKDGRDQDKIFWEPGATYITNEFYIKNEGNLNLKFKIKLNLPESSANALVDVVDFDIFTDSTNVRFHRGEESIALAGKIDLLEGYTYDDNGEEVLFDEYTLLPGAVVGPLTVKAHMAESAGNEFMNKVLDNIGFTIIATQATGDQDSYNGVYDDGLILDFGETLPLEGIMTIEDNVKYIYTDDGEVYLHDAAGYTEDVFYVPENVTALGNYSFAYNNTIKEVILPESVTDLGRGFDSNTTIEKVVLNEGLTEISSRAFKATTALEEVVIPSTLTTIKDNAFQKSGIKEIVIPATVERIEETAFGSATSLEKVTFEGDIIIEAYAFRDCYSLRTVVMKGDAQMVASTLRPSINSTWFCNKSTNNPGFSNITFYVQNETVANRVLVAMGAEYLNTPVYIGDEGVKDLQYNIAKNANDIKSISDNATVDTIIALNNNISGDAKITQKAGVDVVIDGNGKTFSNGILTVFGNGKTHGSNLRYETLLIKNINFEAKAGAESCIVSPDKTPASYSYSHYVTVENCNFAGNDNAPKCAAIRQQDGGDEYWTVRNCTVDSKMHSLMQINNTEGKLIVEGCTINSKNGLNLSSTANVDIIGCNFDNDGYNVRFGASSGGNPNVTKVILIKDSTLKSANAQGDDGNLIFRSGAANAEVTLVNTTITPAIAGMEYQILPATSNVVVNGQKIG